MVGGLKHLIAKREDGYVQLALQFASDITALSDLRMRLWDLMSKSHVCEGRNFTLGLESTYRNICGEGIVRVMYHLYSLKRMEMLQQQFVYEEATDKFGFWTKFDSSLFSVCI